MKNVSGDDLTALSDISRLKMPRKIAFSRFRGRNLYSYSSQKKTKRTPKHTHKKQF